MALKYAIVSETVKCVQHLTASNHPEQCECSIWLTTILSPQSGCVKFYIMTLNDPETGVFTWRKRLSNRVSVGAVAGCRSGNGYVQIWIGGRIYQAHWRVAEGGLDHENPDKGDNRFCNLRPATREENKANVRARNQPVLMALRGTLSIASRNPGQRQNGSPREFRHARGRKRRPRYGRDHNPRAVCSPEPRL